MPFPETDRVVFEHNPIAQVIAQLRFEPILKIGATGPADFQERIRAEYPIYRRVGAPAGLPPDVAQLVEQFGGPVDSPSHGFATADSRRAVTLARDFLTVETREYERWEAFKPKIDEARIAFEAIYRPPFYTRVGLRYVDVIDRRELGLGDEPWSALISERFLGLLGAEQILEEITEIGSSAAIRVGGLPVGSGSARVRYGLKSKRGAAAEDPTRVYVVDADFSINERSAPNHVDAIFNRFNHVAGNLFRWSITERLRDALGPRPVAR